MLGKIGFGILGFTLGLFLIGRSDGLLVAQGGHDSSIAWAQDPMQGAAQDNPGDEIVQPEISDTAPPNVSGSWCGSINDNLLGLGTISMAIKQKGSKLSGSWTDDLGGSVSLKGKVQGTAVIVTLKTRGSKCRFAVNGTLVSPNEVTGNYSRFGCRPSDGGSFDITNPTC